MAVTRARAVTGRSRGKNAHELPGVRPRSLLDAQLAHKIALPNGHSLPAQNVVGRRRMKVKFGCEKDRRKFSAVKSRRRSPETKRIARAMKASTSVVWIAPSAASVCSIRAF